MKTHTGAARILALPALAALLALLGGARAGAAGGACGPYNTPKITVNGEERSWFECGENEKLYGEDIILHCSAKNATHLEMKEDSKSLHVMEVNTTTVQLCVNKQNLGRHRYSCVDGETGCEHCVTVRVIPAMSVVSSRGYYIIYYIPYNWYFVPLGEDYEVFCSGHESEALSLLDANHKRLQTEVINSTSIKYRTQADRVEKKGYICYSNGTTNGEEYKVYDGITVISDYYPEGQKFSCFLYRYRILNCTWNYSTNYIAFKLFLTDLTEGDGDETLLCSVTSGDTTGSCTVDQELMGRELFNVNQNVSLLLMSCNRYFCNNQSFVMNTDVILKTSPVYDLEVLNTSAHGVALSWSYIYAYTNLAHKIEYRHKKLDDDWRLATVSSLRCYGFGSCECRLALPYPDTKYEVRVYARHEAVTDDRLWSAPTSLLVTTEPRVHVCACSAAPETPADPTTSISAETASCGVCTDTEDIIKQSLALKNKIQSMKKKLDKIKEISNLLPAARKLQELLNKV